MNKFKRGLAGITAFLTAFSATVVPQVAGNSGWSITACAADVEATVDNIKYTLNDTDGTASVASRNKNISGAINIPKTITVGSKKYSVTSIGYCAFGDCNGLTSVTIPNSVTTIGNNAFQSCDNLTSVTIPDSVTTIGGAAFIGCKNLTSITIPDSVTSIGGGAFSNCEGLTSITIPNGVTSIDDHTFERCSSLKSITIPDSVTFIGAVAFSHCSSLTSIKIPKSVTSIGDMAFYLSGTKNISVDEDNPNYSSDSGVLFDKNKTVLIQYPIAKENTSYTIPDGISTIANNAFVGCLNLTSITIPNSVTSIGDTAFYKCSGLTNITIPNSVTSIGMLAFSGCTSLTSIKIPNSVTSISAGAFDGCTGLTSITIPDSVTAIGSYAFACSGLTSITIPNNVTAIWNDAFSDCTSLTSITIPNSVTTIDNWAFCGCTSLTSITIPNSVTFIGEWAFSGCEGLTSITLPSRFKDQINDLGIDESKVKITYTDASTDKAPVVDGKKTAWSDVAKDIAKLTSGNTKSIDLNGATNVPADVVKAIATSKAKVTLKVDNEFSWTVNGSSVSEKNAKAGDFSVTKAKVSAENTPRGTQGTSFSVNGTNVNSKLNINFKAANVGEFANLYKKVDGKLVFADNVKIDANGAASGLKVSDKGEYVVMLGKFSDRAGDLNNDGITDLNDALDVVLDFLDVKKGENPLVCDFGGDGIDLSDALEIINIFLNSD